MLSSRDNFRTSAHSTTMSRPTQRQQSYKGASPLFLQSTWLDLEQNQTLEGTGGNLQCRNHCKNKVVLLESSRLGLFAKVHVYKR
jgi:hypothetical protein